MEYTRHPDYCNVLYPEKWNMGAASGEASKPPVADVARVAKNAEEMGRRLVGDALPVANIQALLEAIHGRDPQTDPPIRGTDNPDVSA